MLLIALVLIAAPPLVLLALVFGGLVEAGSALLGMSVATIAGLGCAALFYRDLGALRHRLENASLGGARARSREPILPPLAALSADIGRRIRDLTEHADQAEKAARGNRTIIEIIPDPLVLLGVDHRVRHLNPAAERLLGTETRGLLRHPALREALSQAQETGLPQSVELVLPVPVERVLRVAVAPLDPSLGEDRMVILLTDQTTTRAVERMRADFVANVSHELRTPLAGLIGFIETLQGPAADDPAAQKRFLNIMAELGARMHRLIDDLLSLSRIELTEHTRPTDLVDLGALVERSAVEFEPALHARGATLTVAVDPATPPVIGDADQLSQVLQNIIDNALKYGGKGVAVRMVLGPSEGEEWPSAPGVLISIHDNGPGIARHHLPRLTERFYRVDAARSRSTGGTGLGLAIVRHIVNRHRGRLRIDSVESQGTSCRVWLPVDAPPMAGMGLS